MNYSVSKSYISRFPENSNSQHSRNFAIKKSEIEFWGYRMLDLSPFSIFFKPDEITVYDVEHYQEITQAY